MNDLPDSTLDHSYFTRVRTITPISSYVGVLWEKSLDRPGQFTEPALAGLGVQGGALGALGGDQEREQGVLGDLVPQPH